MGRGRAKAKQTKVARELKYHSPDTDLDALQRELSGNGEPDTADPDAADPYAGYLESVDKDDDADDARSSARR
jgi:hypothetical protein